MKQVKQALKSVAVAVCAAVLLSLPYLFTAAEAQGQGYYPNTYAFPTTLQGATTGPWTNYIAGAASISATNFTPWRIDTAGAKELSFELKVRCVATNTATIQAAIGRNNTGSTDTNQIEYFTLVSTTANGTNWATACSNLSVLGTRFYYLLWLTNNNGAAGSAVTNWGMTVNLK